MILDSLISIRFDSHPELPFTVQTVCHFLENCGEFNVKKKPRITTLKGTYDAARYRERVSRNVCMLGLDATEQERSQERLSNAVVGIAGMGGLGSHLAFQLARLGVRHLKVADLDHYELSNMNRQLGADGPNLGKNKAIVMGEMIHESLGDVTLEIYPEGIQRHTAESFAAGCDLLFDLTDFYLIDERYALHRAFREHSDAACMLCSCVWGWGATIYKFTRDGMTYEDLLDIPEGTKIEDSHVERLMLMQANYLPRFPSLDTVREWMTKAGNAPVLGATPPLGCGLLATRACLILCDLEREPYCRPLPAIPEYFLLDAAGLNSGFYKFDGQWANEGIHEELFGDLAATG